MKKIDLYLDHVQEIATAMVVLSTASLLVTATNLYKQYFTKNARQCSGLAANERSICMLNAKMLAKKVQLGALKDAINKCKKSKNSEQCKAKISVKADKIGKEIKYLIGRIKDARSRVYSK